MFYARENHGVRDNVSVCIFRTLEHLLAIDGRSLSAAEVCDFQLGFQVKLSLLQISLRESNKGRLVHTPSTGGTSRTLSIICFRDIVLLSRKTCFPAACASLSLDFVVRPYSLCDPGFIHSRFPPERLSCSMNHMRSCAIDCDRRGVLVHSVGILGILQSRATRRDQRRVVLSEAGRTKKLMA